MPVAMRLLDVKAGEIVEGPIGNDAHGEVVLEAGGRRYGALEALDSGLSLIEASDAERQALVDAGYALPSHVAEHLNDRER
jgi:hypothetical protein